MPADWPRGESVPLRRHGTAAVELDDNVALYDELAQLLILLNSSAAAVWERCDGATTLNAMVRELAAAHPADADVIEEDVRQTAGKLAELGLLVDAAPAADGVPRA